jgi:hypothetical protein
VEAKDLRIRIKRQSGSILDVRVGFSMSWCEVSARWRELVVIVENAVGVVIQEELLAEVVKTIRTL